MSESDFGVALLNDSKYGHEADAHWMRLTLLKGSVSPDPIADLETHYFTYVLYPHIGGWRQADVIGAAARLNTILYTQRTEQVPTSHSFIQCDAPNVTLEAVKRSQDGAYLILRLVERTNTLTRTTLTFDRPIEAAYRCNLMETKENELTVAGSSVQVELRPHEIVTVAIR